MRIAMLSPNLPPRRCGVGDNTYRLARQLQGLRHRVTLLACSGGEDGPEDGLEVIVVPGEPWRPGRAGQLAERVRGCGAQLFHYHYVPFLYGRRGISLGASLLPVVVRRAGVPVVTTLHELAMPWAASPGRFTAAALQRVQLALLVGGSDAVIVTTRHRESKLSSWFPWKASRIHLVPVGATIDVDAGADREAVRRELGLDGRVVLGFFGTAHPSKGLGLTARCLEGLAAEGVDARLLCIGVEAGELRGILAGGGEGAERILERSICTGWVPPGRVSHLLAAVDLFLQPLVDGVSTLRTSTMAALAHGLAVVGTRGRETDGELFGEGGVRLVPAGDEEAFRRSVALLAGDPERRAALAAAGRALFHGRFSWPRLAEATLAVYGGLVHGHGDAVASSSHDSVQG